MPALKRSPFNMQWPTVGQASDKPKPSLKADEFMRRFLLHVLPGGFHRIRHYGLIANSGRRENLARARELLHVTPVEPKEREVPNEVVTPIFVCRECGAPMVVTGILARAPNIRAPPPCRVVP